MYCSCSVCAEGPRAAGPADGGAPEGPALQQPGPGGAAQRWEQAAGEEEEAGGEGGRLGTTRRAWEGKSDKSMSEAPMSI